MCIGKRADDRKCSAGHYRYGFNGKEKDADGEWGSNTHYDYGFRIYNPAIAKFLSVDPLAPDYPYYTPYQFAGNMPIWAIDLDGLEPEFRTDDNGVSTDAYGKELSDGDVRNANDQATGQNSDWIWDAALGDFRANTLAEVTVTAETNADKYRVTGLNSGAAKLFTEKELFDFARTRRTLGLTDLSDGLYEGSFGDLGTEFFLHNMRKVENKAAEEFANFMTPVTFFIGGGGVAVSRMFVTRVAFARPLIQVSRMSPRAFTNFELIVETAIRAEKAIGGTGHRAGTLKHSYATKLLKKYQGIYGGRGIETNFYFRGQNGKGYLDVLDTQNSIIYDFKFGELFMKKSQFTKYSNEFNFPIILLDGFGNGVGKIR